MLVPGLYAWGVTVAWPASQRFTAPAARGLALAALVALGAGSLLAAPSPQAGRLVGVWGFLGCSFAAWVLMAPALAPGQLDPLFGMLGSIGWIFFAIAWGSASEPAGVPRPDRGPSPPLHQAHEVNLAVACPGPAPPFSLPLSSPRRFL